MQNDERISVIIPAYNESDSIWELVHYLEDAGSERIEEILVVDGGSTDGTAEVAKEAGARVIHSPRKGRAAQMNSGAAVAKGGILYFLHADTRPPRQFDRLILSELEKGTAAGCFRLRFDDPHPLLRWYSVFTRLKTVLVRFGDQSLFVRKKLFLNIGGFREELLVMEDQEVIRRIKKEGRFSVLKESVITSARTYRENGYVWLQLLFTAIWAGYYLGIPQDRLVQFYRKMIQAGKT
ncbi:MAG: glycosyltransferase [Balneolaceae bacterium]|nr:MAG: glycosyltransferase [Balneolaceae bacterium]